MNRFTLRLSLIALLLAGLTAVSASAQGKIPAGKDYWTTPANGKTFFTFPEGDVESLCGVEPSDDWNHKLVLKGIPLDDGPAYDTVVARLKDAVFDDSGLAKTEVQVAELHFASIEEQDTPCGPLTWQVGLAGSQGSTVMVLTRTASGSGYFHADLKVKVELRAYKSGTYLGSLFYDFTLPDPGSGTPWSIGPAGEFRAGMTASNNCIDVLREELGTYATDSDHWYFISDLIAQGKCIRK